MLVCTSYSQRLICSSLSNSSLWLFVLLLLLNTIWSTDKISQNMFISCCREELLLKNLTANKALLTWWQTHFISCCCFTVKVSCWFTSGKLLMWNSYRKWSVSFRCYQYIIKDQEIEVKLNSNAQRFSYTLQKYWELTETQKHIMHLSFNLYKNV